MKGIGKLILLTMVLTLITFTLVIGTLGTAHARSTFLSQFNTKYGTAGTAIDSCSLCHPGGNTGSFNQFALDFGSTTIPSHMVFTFDAALEARDSDGDTFTNIIEINARTFPGNANSKPISGPSDTTPPTVSFSTGSFLTPRKISIVLTATDDTGGSGVSGYMVKSSATAPRKSSPNWKVTPPTAFKFPLTATTGPQTLYAWVKDRAGNVSAVVSVPVNLDVTKPTVTAFTGQATSPASGTVNISVTATDPTVNGVASGVSAYMITKSNLTPPSRTSTKWMSGSMPPTGASFPTAIRPGATLYAWVKDVNRNISKPKAAKVTAPVAAVAAQQPQSTQLKVANSVTAAVTQQAQSLVAPVVQPQQNTQTTAVPNASVDMTVWVGKWFKITEKISNSQGTNSITGYMKIWGWDPSTNELQVDRYDEDPQQPGQWFSETLSLDYVSGSVLDFICNYQGSYQNATATETLSFVAQFIGTISSGVLTGGQLKTLSGYYVETEHSSAAAQHYSAGLTITGKLVPESGVPVPSGTLLH